MRQVLRHVTKTQQPKNRLQKEENLKNFCAANHYEKVKDETKNGKISANQVSDTGLIPEYTKNSHNNNKKTKKPN